MPARSHGRFIQVISFLDSLKRGRNRRRRKQSSSMTPASETLESRTLLSAVDAFSIASTPLTPTMKPAPGSEIGYENGEAVFKTGSDVEISWNPALDSKDFDIRIYNVDTGQEVVGEDHLTSPEFLPTILSEPGRYQVFLRDTDMNDVTGDWSLPVYFHLTAGTNATPPASAHFTGVTNDPTPLLNWTNVDVSTPFVVTYEVVIYNVKAGQEVLREQTDATSLSLDFLNDSSDEFQAFIRTHIDPPPNVFAPSLTTDWSAPLYFSGEGDSQIPDAATFLPPSYAPSYGTLEWGAIDDADSYEIIVYDMTTGQVAVHKTGVARTSLHVDPPLIAAEPQSPVIINGSEPNDPATSEPTEVHRYQVFYRAHLTGGATTLWSESVEFELAATELTLTLPIGNDTPALPDEV